MTQYVALDVSLEETKLHVLDEAGNRVWRGRCATDPAVIAATVRRYAPSAARIGLETGPLTTWLWTALTASSCCNWRAYCGTPASCHGHRNWPLRDPGSTFARLSGTLPDGS